jgi:hypothetical protein
MRRLITTGTKGKRVIQKKSRIILKTASEDLVEKASGMFSGKPSLSKELARQRGRKDRW